MPTPIDGMRSLESVSASPRRLDGVLSSWNAETRTFHVTASTGAVGVQFDSLGSYDEALSMAPGACDLSRANNHAPFIDCHGFVSDVGAQAKLTKGYVISDAHIGNIVPGSARQTSAGIEMDVTLFGEDVLADSGLRTSRKVANGDARHVSIDYAPLEIRTTPKARRTDGGKRDLVELVRWQITGLSSVPMGLDDKAMTRSFPEPQPKETEKMDPEEKVAVISPPAAVVSAASPVASERAFSATTPPASSVTGTDTVRPPSFSAPVATPAPAQDPVALRASMAAEMRSISAEYGERAMKAGLSVEDARKLEADIFEHKTTPEEALKRIADAACSRSASTTGSIRGALRAEIGKSGEEKRSEAMRNALMFRLTDGQHKLEAGNYYAGRSLTQMGAELLGLRDEFGDRDTVAIAERMISGARAVGLATTDFPSWFSTAVNASLLILAAAEPLTYEQFVKDVPSVNFNPRRIVKLSGSGAWSEIGEGARGKPATVSEAGEAYTPKSFAKELHVSRKMIIDDNLNGVSTLLNQVAVGSRITRNNLVYGLLLDNGKIASDNKAIFHSAHSNITTTHAVPSLTTIAAVGAAMSAQTDDNGERIGVKPAFILTGEYNADDVALQQFLADFSANATTSTVPDKYRKSIIPVSDYRIPQGTWFALANPMLHPVIETTYLNGNREPISQQIPCTLSEGLKYEFLLDFGCGLVDWRGAHRVQNA